MIVIMNVFISPHYWDVALKATWNLSHLELFPQFLEQGMCWILGEGCFFFFFSGEELGLQVKICES